MFDMLNFNEWGSVLAAVLLGMFIGGVYFAALWWTVNRTIASPNPLRFYFLSLVIRLGLLLLVLYGAFQFGDWHILLAGLLGFILARILLVRRIGRDPLKAAREQEVSR